MGSAPHPAATPDDTDWPRIVALYDTLAQVTPSPVVELNRAVAYAMAFGPQVGLDLVDRADFLAKLGRNDEARVELLPAASLARNYR